MGLFDFLKRMNNSFFDGIKEKAIENALSNAKEDRLKKEAFDKSEKSKKEKDDLDKILSSIPKPKILSENELAEIRLKKEKKDRIKQIERENKEKLKNDLINKYGQEVGEKLFKKELFVGMTFEMLKEIKPKHSKKVSNVTNGKETIKLYYGIEKNRLGNDSYNFEVTLKDGLVAGWKDLSNIGRRES